MHLIVRKDMIGSLCEREDIVGEAAVIGVTVLEQPEANIGHAAYGADLDGLAAADQRCGY
jgi:hypothetical protein